MRHGATLDRYLCNAPPAPCREYGAGSVVVCTAKGKAKNRFVMSAKTAAIAMETDGDTYRFPPDSSQLACDWCVFTKEGHKAFFVELKGSDFVHAVEQIESIMQYMVRTFALVPRKAFAVLNGRHPSNTRTGKANAKAKFKNRHPGVELCERSPGQAKPEDVII